MFINGSGYGTIIDFLNQKGYTTKKGAQFGKNSLHEILKNEKYTGKLIFNRRSSKNTDGKINAHKYKDESEWIVINNGCPAIISKEKYEEVQKIMEKNKKRAASYKAKENYLLSGILFCGLCHKSMVGESKKGRNGTYHYYSCNEFRRKRNCENT